MKIPEALPGQEIVAGPERRRHEIVWQLALADGRRAVLAQLAPELADDEALRRRYVHEAERLRDLEVDALAPVLASGPAPDPRAPDAAPPWSARLDPPGEDFEDLLAKRAPLPVDEAIDRVARIAETVHGLHAAGVVVRDLEPAKIRFADSSDRVWLLDVGSSRFGVLSSRTASSMLLESSPYAAPEHLRTTVVDPRADVYSLGVMAWRAFTGELPFGDAHQVMMGRQASAPLRALRPEVPVEIAEAVTACLEESPDARPASARQLAALLRGEERFRTAELVRVTCQACGQPLRAGLRLCLSCGREAVQLHHEIDPRAGYAVILKSAREDEDFDSTLRGILDDVAGPGDRRLAFLVGDRRMYSKEERSRRIGLPVRLFSDLPESTAYELARRMREEKLDVKVKRSRPRLGRRFGRALVVGGIVGMVTWGATIPLGSAAASILLVFASTAAFITGMIVRRNAKRSSVPLARLRAAPAALPASDPLVSKLAAVLGDRDIAPDLRERVAELALHTQRLVDHRAGRRSDDGSLELAIEPVARLVELAASEATALVELDRELGELDEGALVRALAASRARDEPAHARAGLLAGLDRLRVLEDRRSAGMRRLLTAAHLVRRATELAMTTGDPVAEEERLFALAMAELES